MKIRIIASESFGVRSLATMVETTNRKICIDPGLALDNGRGGFSPHPFQILKARYLRSTIRHELSSATDIIISHYHGDHLPMPTPDLYQLSLSAALTDLHRCRLWFKGPNFLSRNQKNRRDALERQLQHHLIDIDGSINDELLFSPAVPHGERNTPMGTVVMTCIHEKNVSFVHASDIQLLNDEAIDWIISWRPQIVLTAGPPLYLISPKASHQLNRIQQRLIRLASQVSILIVDHHILRDESGWDFLNTFRKDVSTPIMTAAEFMHQPNCFLEAWRALLYQESPVPPVWHQKYQEKKEIEERYHSWRSWSVDPSDLD